MKKLLLALSLVLILLVTTVSPVFADHGRKTGDTIQDGTILDSSGNVITLGFDAWGYNYQAHLFSGLYNNYSRPAVPVTAGDSLVMKWNDAWLSNMDRDGDHKLDRHYGFPSYRGSGAWLTNQMVGTYEEDGVIYKYTYFCKIVAAPLDAVISDGVWYAADGTEIGPDIWGQFAVILEVSNDQGTGEHGVSYKSPGPVGFGCFQP